VEKKPIVIFCTTPDMDCAKKIAHFLVEKKLAACCNILPEIKSVYSWEGQLKQDDELLIVIKTNLNNFNDIEDGIKKLHPYDVPEIISIDITAGSNEYLSWISENVR